MNCIHQGKNNCSYCKEIFNKPINDLTRDWYAVEFLRKNGIHALGIIEGYWYLKAHSEKNGYSKDYL